MVRLALIIGGLLVILGLGGWLLGHRPGSEYAHWTALIPAIPGVLILLCGLVATTGPLPRMVSMHIAVVVAGLSVLASFGGMGRIFRGEAGAITIVSIFGMLLLCLFFVVAGVRSFVAARREKQVTTS